MKAASIVGQTLDGKYRIESEIGKGGMGAVYLATHVGTGRPVALKVIASEFMQRAEFVERFRREARAAGRLRHPNVVNVTDFGFARTNTGEAAYLVMEYLDGCTLGEILEEEKQLPLAWTIDILEQVCSAVQEAHEQGIIHRDLKPDNIWLEPNQRGGYTVKVLDFGIAKLEEHAADEIAPDARGVSAAPHLPPAKAARATIADGGQTPTVIEKPEPTLIHEAATIAQFARADAEAGTLIQSASAPDSEGGTLIQSATNEPATVIFDRSSAVDTESGTLIQANSANAESGTSLQASRIDAESGTLIQSSRIDSESGTAVFPAAAPSAAAFAPRRFADTENVGTRLASEPLQTSRRTPAATAELTRVGAVLGTPLYMSPEQCRGERLTAQSDIYSLGVIAYQMLSGKTPFAGDYLDVMEAHKTAEPPALENKKIRKKVKRVINAALSKSVNERPPTAQAFAAELRAESEGIRALFRRALMIYSQHLGRFLALSLILYAPVAVFTVLQIVVGFLFLSESIGAPTKNALNGIVGLGSTFCGFFCGYLVFGTTTWLVAQILAVPLRPVSLRPALRATRRKWKTFAGTGTMSSMLTLIGLTLCFVPGAITSVLWALVAPVVMMENLRGRAALRRSKNLVKRSLRTTAFTVFIMFFVPLSFSGVIAFLTDRVVKSFTPSAVVRSETERRAASDDAPTEASRNGGTQINIGADKQIKISNESRRDGEPRNMGDRVRGAVSEALTQIFILPLSILIGSFSSIVIALLYLKTRQVGGEPMQDLLAQFEEADQPRTNWQRRVHARLEQSGRITSRS